MRPRPNLVAGALNKGVKPRGDQRDGFRRQDALYGHDLPLHHVPVGDEAVQRNHCRERGKMVRSVWKAAPAARAETLSLPIRRHVVPRIVHHLAISD